MASTLRTQTLTPFLPPSNRPSSPSLSRPLAKHSPPLLMHPFSLLSATVFIVRAIFCASLLGTLVRAAPESRDKHEQQVNRRSLWNLQQTYQGSTFFDDWDFWSYPDPTHGQVQYVSRDHAWNEGLIYIQPKTSQPVIQVDYWNDLPFGANRNSVRMTSNTVYRGGLFILDVDKIPYGCSSWPAFWLVGPNWPYGGEIDVIETLHNNEQAQLTVHTGPGCTLVSPGLFSGKTLGTTCTSGQGGNHGCSIKSNNTASAGAAWQSLGGGVYVLEWTGDGIRIWIFNRGDVPNDINDLNPNPSGWKLADAAYAASGCDPFTYFQDMQMIFDTTICGDWAGSGGSWSESGCPGTCAESVMKGSNFINAQWIINSLRVYSTGGTTYSSINVKNDSNGVPVRPTSSSASGFITWSLYELTFILGLVLGSCWML